MGQYKEDAARLLELVGGKENIAAVSHCITRMRFVLQDTDKADVPGIEALKSVKGSFTQAGQFQVIIGNTVGDFYDDFVAVSGISGVSKAEVKDAAKGQQNPVQKAMTNIAEIFAPIIPAIICGGLILGFRNCIDSLYLFQDGTATLCDISQFWSGVDSFLWLIGEAVFHMLPVMICWSVMKKMGGSEVLGIVLGLTLVSGQLLNAYSVASTAAADIPKWDFGFVQVNMIGYQAQVIPAILAAFALVYLERFFKKITHPLIAQIIVPFCSLTLAVMAAHFVLGPIGWQIGSVISDVVYAGITSDFRVAFGAIFGALYAPLVITGLHHMSNAIDLQLIGTFGGTMLWPMIALSNIAQGSAVLGMSFVQRKNPESQETNLPCMISCYLGVTEPAIFGINLKYVFPFVCGMIGSCCAAIVSTAFGCTANAVGVGGLPGILSMQPAYWAPYALCMLIAVAVPFVLTVIVGTRNGTAAATEQAGKEIAAAEAAAQPVATPYEEGTFYAFLSGKTVAISQVPDATFAEKILGDGIAIEPTDNVLRSPVAGTVSNLMEGSNHACGITTESGLEVLLHIGLDTVDMNGDGFRPMVKEGDTVRPGDPLIVFDPEKIAAAGHPAITMMVVTDEAGHTLDFHPGEAVEAGNTPVGTFTR